MKGLPVLVPDASVLLKWVLKSEDEEDRDAALALREAWLAGRCAIVIPSLWFFEVSNVLGLKQPDLALPLMKILIGYGMEEEAPEALYEKTFELMKAFKVTFYDAVYHATAIRHSGTLITADDMYYRRTSRVGHVTTLREWRSLSRL